MSVLTDNVVAASRDLDNLKARRASILRQLQELETDAALSYDTVGSIQAPDGPEARELMNIMDQMAALESAANEARISLE